MIFMSSFHQVLDGAGERPGKGSKRRGRGPVNVLHALFIELYVANVHARETGQLRLGISGGNPHARNNLARLRHLDRHLEEAMEGELVGGLVQARVMA